MVTSFGTLFPQLAKRAWQLYSLRSYKYQGCQVIRISMDPTLRIVLPRPTRRGTPADAFSSSNQATGLFLSATKDAGRPGRQASRDGSEEGEGGGGAGNRGAWAEGPRDVTRYVTWPSSSSVRPSILRPVLTQLCRGPLGTLFE